MDSTTTTTKATTTTTKKQTKLSVPILLQSENQSLANGKQYDNYIIIDKVSITSKGVVKYDTLCLPFDEKFTVGGVARQLITWFAASALNTAKNSFKLIDEKNGICIKQYKTDKDGNTVETTAVVKDKDVFKKYLTSTTAVVRKGGKKIVLTAKDGVKLKDTILSDKVLLTLTPKLTRKEKQYLINKLSAKLLADLTKFENIASLQSQLK